MVFILISCCHQNSSSIRSFLLYCIIFLLCEVYSIKMTNSHTADWSRLTKEYDPLKAGSIDGTDTEPHDHGIVRALNAEYYPDRSIKGKPECTIFIAKLPKITTETSLKKAFSYFGHIRRCRVVRDIVTGASKGYGFIEYDTPSAASSACARGGKLVVDDTFVFVDFECERLLPGWVPRRLGGGFGGKKESGQLRFGGRARPFKKPLVIGSSNKYPENEQKGDIHKFGHFSKGHSSRKQ